MAPVRVCEFPGCHVVLSVYNPHPTCWEHRRVRRRIQEELDGRIIQRDDEWALEMAKLAMSDGPPPEVETWRAHVMTQTFIEGISEPLSKAEKRRYENSGWLG